MKHRREGEGMGSPQPDLVTGRMVLRSLCPGDSKQIATLATDPGVSKYMLEIPHPYTEPLAQEWIAGLAAAYDTGTDVIFGISLRDSGELIGVAGLIGINTEHSRAKLGYWIGRPYWNCGFATEAVGALIDFGFRVLGLNRIYAFYMAGNPASGRVMEKCGMRHEGILRQHIRKSEQFVDIAAHGILREEFLADSGDPHHSR
jgi:ribosomal-protein-alanine N-acetyltransferase